MRVGKRFLSPSTPSIKDGFNLSCLTPARDSSTISLTYDRPNHQWFAAYLTELDTRKEITVDILTMKDNGVFQDVNICKWIGLRPVCTYADPFAYQTYEWYYRDEEGQWWSADFCKPEDKRYAGCTRLPEQLLLSPVLAERCLSADGCYWSPWFDLPDVAVNTKQNSISIRCCPEDQAMAFAMHFPFTYGYSQQWIDKLSAVHFPGVFIDAIGQTREGRDLRIIRVDDPEAPTPLIIDDFPQECDGQVIPTIRIETVNHSKAHRVILVTAREHGPEHTTSWIIRGLLRRLLDPQYRDLRTNTTWLLVPMFDPDASAKSIVTECSYSFYPHHADPRYGDKTPQEVIAYAMYLRAFIESGRPIDVVTSFFCLECNEGKVVLCPAAMDADVEVTNAVTKTWFSRLQLSTDIHLDSPFAHRTIILPFRPGGWCSDVYGSLSLLYQVNDRYPEHRLNLQGIEQLGESFALSLHEFLSTPVGENRMQYTRGFLARRQLIRKKWYRGKQPSPHSPISVNDLLSLGF